VAITIDDEGPGIAPHELEAVFAPFHRVESSRNRNTGGTGLGLYIARDLAARQGASVTLRNRDTGGLRAEVRLPR
jgi:signal transduction histidine kinase